MTGRDIQSTIIKECPNNGYSLDGSGAANMKPQAINQALLG
jgi:hypothetical protein